MVAERQGTHLALYFNLTYGCNSACSFCASASQHNPQRHDLPEATVLAAFDRLQLQAGDTVVLNGGEPTTYRPLHQVVAAAATRGAQVTLFTNGRRMGDPAYAVPLLAAGVHRLSIPIHGFDPATHDALTGRPGSWQQTARAVRLAHACRAELGRPAHLELKLLAVRPVLPEWAAVVDWLARQGIEPEPLVLSGLHMWSPATGGYCTGIVPTVDELRLHANAALRRALAHGYPVVTWAMPLCLFEPELAALVQTASDRPPVAEPGSPANVQTIYFDAFCPAGVTVPQEEVVQAAQMAAACQTCDLRARCGPAQAFLGLVTACSTPIPATHLAH